MLFTYWFSLLFRVLLCLCFVASVVTKVKQAIKYANHVIHLATMPQNRVLESLEQIQINDNLLRSLKEINPKNEAGGKEGFLIPLGTFRNKVIESTFYLGCLELNLFNYLDRKTTESNALFDQRQAERIILILQLEDLVVMNYYTCVIPLTNKYDMLRDDCLYNDNCFEYVNFVYKHSLLNASNINRIYQLVFSCLPLLTGCDSLRVDVYENVFAKYFKRAAFVRDKCNITEIYRLYTYNVLCESNYKTLNYLLLRYNALPDLQEFNGYDCFSQYSSDDRDEIIASKCFNNKSFQLVIVYGNSPKAHIQFYLHVAYDVFNDLLKGSIEEEYGNDDQFISLDCDNFTVYVFRKTQKKKEKLILTLVEQSILRFLILLYKGKLDYTELHAYVLSVCYSPVLFETLAKHVFVNLFSLASEYFDSSLDEIYSIIFTCVVLSDVNFVNVTSKSSLNGGMVSIVYYFYSLYHVIVCDANKNQRIVHENRGNKDSPPDDWITTNYHFGLHMKPYDLDSNNFLEIRYEYLEEQMGFKRTTDLFLYKFEYCKRPMIMFKFFFVVFCLD